MMGLHEVEFLAGRVRRAREERAPRGVTGRLPCYAVLALINSYVLVGNPDLPSGARGHVQPVPDAYVICPGSAVPAGVSPIRAVSRPGAPVSCHYPNATVYRPCHGTDLAVCWCQTATRSLLYGTILG